MLSQDRLEIQWINKQGEKLSTSSDENLASCVAHQRTILLINVVS